MVPFFASRKEKEKEDSPFLTSRKSPQSRADQFAGYFFRTHYYLPQLGRGLFVSFEVPGQLGRRPFFLAKRDPSFLLLIEEKKAKEDQGGFGRQRSMAGYMQLGTSLFVSFEVSGQLGRHP